MTTLNYDANGFIVGINRMKDGIDNVHDDTQEIIQILKSQNQIGNTRMRELTRAVKSANYRSESQASANTSRTRSSSSDRRPRISSASDGSASNSGNGGRVSNAPANRSRVSRDSSGRADRINSSGSSDSSTRSGGDSSSTARRERDANGRFISDGSNSKRGFGLPGGFGSMGQSDMGGMDPLLDSLKEAKDLLSPIGRAGKLAGRAAKFSWSKFKSMKRREPLSNDETRHNRENEKLLDKIWKAIRRQGGQGGNAGRGLLGGLLGGASAAGGLLKKLGKMKFLGPLAALAGAGSLAMDWDNLDHQGKSEGVGGLAGAGVGGLAGMKLGAMAGAIGGPVGMAIGGAVGGIAGAWLGSEGGEALGAAASPYIEDWTDSLQRYNLAEKMDSFWKDSMKPIFSSFRSLGEKTKSWFADKFDGLFGGNSGSPAGEALRAADYAIKNAANESLGKCAEYVNNAFQAQGLKASGHGVDVATNLRKGNEGKFEDVAYDENYQPQVGDVMSMPSSKKSKHNYGHVAVYTDQGWVSDYKQGEKYGNTAAPNSDYYEDIKSGRIKPTISRMINKDVNGPNMAGQTRGMQAKSNQAMKYFMSQGWTREQAAGIVGNLQKESNFDHTAVGDGGKAKGIAQWHPDRQAKFQARYGKSMSKSSYAEQLAFVNHELTSGTEQAAGKRLRKATTAAQAGAVVSEFYERPANTEAEKRERAQIAASISKNYSLTSNKTPPPKSGNGILGVSAKDINKAITPKISNSSNGTPLKSHLGYEPANLPASPVLKIPDMPKVKERLDSGGSNKPVMLQASSDTINQNLSDRGLAHAVTGGFGQDRMWG